MEMRVDTQERDDPLFLLAPPCSFSSLFGAMFGQHSQLYGPPETHLFIVETMAEWWDTCSRTTFNMEHGLLRAVAQLYFGEETETSIKLAGGGSGAEPIISQDISLKHWQKESSR